MAGRTPLNILPAENMLHISWHDSGWIPFLNPTNIMDYFSEKSNSFYDRTCNNEIVKMQRQSMDQLENMIGVEYVLLHVKEPILYVIRKQHRHSPKDTTPLTDYYIIAGRVYQAPDLASVFNSRLLSTVHHLQSAFEEASSYAKFQTSKGYSWDFTANKTFSDNQTEKKEPEKVKEEPGSQFQRQRVDILLGELLRKFPIPQAYNANVVVEEKPVVTTNTPATATTNTKTETTTPSTTIKTEPIDEVVSTPVQIKQEKPENFKPPEKKMKL